MLNVKLQSFLRRLIAPRPKAVKAKYIKIDKVTPLTPIVCDLIASQGSLSLERYMELALHHPDYGYYSQGNPLGIDGDFGTSPEISQMFGEMIGVWCVEMWRKMGRPASFVLLELGPGRGMMLHAMFRLIKQETEFLAAMKLCLLESSVTLRAIQAEKLLAYRPIHIGSLDEVPSLPIIVLANEFFDTFPIRQFLKTRRGWREYLIDCKKGKLVFVKGSEKALPIEGSIAPACDHVKTGKIYEVSPQSQSVIEKLSSHIMHYGGAALVIDYGYTSHTGKSTLDAWSRHKYTNVLSAPGMVDVTAGVDFSALGHVAEKQGLQVEAVIGQGEFLLRAGIAFRAKILRQNANRATVKAINDDFYRLVSPLQMGESFKVLEMKMKGI